MRAPRSGERGWVSVVTRRARRSCRCLVGRVDFMTQGLRTFLTFQEGVASAALDLYRDVFADFELVSIDRYGGGEAGAEGTVKVALFRLAGSDLSCADSPVRHAWGFTPG